MEKILYIITILGILFFVYIFINNAINKIKEEEKKEVKNFIKRFDDMICFMKDNKHEESFLDQIKSVSKNWAILFVDSHSNDFSMYERPVIKKISETLKSYDIFLEMSAIPSMSYMEIGMFTDTESISKEREESIKKIQTIIESELLAIFK